MGVANTEDGFLDQAGIVRAKYLSPLRRCGSWLQ
jgi:hypothetical protein